jgi:hypothetical protein
MTGELWAGVKTSVKGPSSDLPQTQLNLVIKAVLARCAGHDGGLKTDAFLNDPRACHFDPNVLQCHAERSPDTCLSADQVAAVEPLYQGAVHPRTHKQIYPGFALGSETFWRQALVGEERSGRQLELILQGRPSRRCSWRRALTIVRRSRRERLQRRDAGRARRS